MLYMLYAMGFDGFLPTTAFERGEQRADDPDYRYIPRQPRRRRAVPYADREGKDPPDNKGPTPASDSDQAA